jgi:probable phosphoglycerate mutase
MPVDIYIARHGETTWNAVGRYQGRLDTPLSPLGQAQAQALCAALARKQIERIISSPLSRCVQTAMPLSIRTGVPVETDPLLLEIAHGDWQGRYRDEIAASEPERYRDWREHPERVRFAGGESLADVAARWKGFVEAFSPRANTLIVTHDIVLKLAVLERTGRPMSDLRRVRALNAAYARFQITGGVWTLEDPCVDEHLAGLAADVERQAL